MKRLQQLPATIRIWAKNNNTEFVLLLGILLLALILRVWKIDQYLPFLGDEGRDVRVVRRFLTQGDLMFIGPRTSIGDMYLGPLFYYLISPFLLLWNFSPVGPAVFVSLVSVITSGFIWYTVREWFGKYGALAGAFLYAISPVIIIHARHSWNPNIMPFLALLSIYSVWRVWQKREYKWLLITGVSFGAAIQSHYLGLLLAPTLGLIWLIAGWTARLKQQELKRFIKYSLGAFGVFSLLMSPLVLFDWKHGWHNFLSLKTFFFNRQTTVSAKPWTAVPDLWPLWSKQVVAHLLTAENLQIGLVISLVLVLALVYFLYRTYKQKKLILPNPLILIFVWTVAGLLGLGLIKQAIYDHYFGFLFPVPFILFGLLFQKLYVGKLKIIALLLLAGIAAVNLQQNPLKYPPQNQLQKVQDIDHAIVSDSANKPFNFALIAKQNYEEGYLYYFELWNTPVREIDPLNVNGTLTEQLYVVCEDQVCQPINNAKAEVANFGWQKQDKMWEVDGTKIYRLVHADKL